MQNHLSYECIIHEGCLIREVLATNVPASGCGHQCTSLWMQLLRLLAKCSVLLLAYLHNLKS